MRKRRMSKIDTYTKIRMEGLAWALKIIENEDSLEKGVDMLRKEIRFRNIVRLPLEIPAIEIAKANRIIKQRMLNIVMVVIIKVLDEDYGWKKKRLAEFMERFARHTLGMNDVDPYGEKYVEISHYAEYFRENYDADFSVEAIEEMIKVEEENRSAGIKRVQFDIIEKHLKNSYPEALEHLKKQLGA